MDVLEMRQAVTDAQISQAVQKFYARARTDPILGPVFDRRVEDSEWPGHIERISAFWSTVLRGTGTYRGDPMAAHVPLDEVGEEHFARWLALWGKVVEEVLPATVADAVNLRAERMGVRLRAAMGL